MKKFVSISIFLILLIILTGCKFNNNEENINNNENKKNETNISSAQGEIDILARTINVYIEENLTNSEIQNIKKQIEKIEGAAIVRYISKEDAYYVALEKIGEESVNIAGYSKYNHPFPPSFDVIVDNKSEIESISKKISNINNVRGINFLNENQIRDYILYNVLK